MTSTYGRLSRKVLGAALAGTLGLSAAAALVPGVASANQATTTQRVAGTDRYGTASTIATTAFPNGSNNIVLASGENFPDGLAAATLAGALNAPVLLTGKDTLPAVTASTAKSIDNGVAGPATIYIVGGTTAVSQAVRDQLTSLGYTLNETGGADRYATASAVATKAASTATAQTFNGLRTAIVATGESFPDALAAGAVAYNFDMPILLTPSASLGASASTSLTSLGTQQAIIMGGTAAVSQATEDAIKAKGISIVRIAGTNRNDTAAKLATREITPAGQGGFGFTGTQVFLASGLNFPDALASAPLAGGALGGTPAGPILLTASLPAETSAFLATNKATITKVWGIGGTTAVSDADLAAAQTAATTASPTATISATAGSRVITIKFSEAVTAATAQNMASYTKNNAAFAGTAVYNTSTTTVTITIPDASPALVAGDVIAVKAASVLTADNRAAAPTSFTVVADTTKPTASIKAATNSPSTQNHVFVIFSEPVTSSTTGGTTAAFDFQDVVASTSGTATSLTQISPTVYQANFAAALTAGETITVGTSYQDVAGNIPAAQTQSTVASDVAGPGIAQAKLTLVSLSQAARTIDGTGDVLITALASGAAGGAAGNAWNVVVVDNNSALSIGVNSSAKTITIASDLDNSNSQQTTATAVSTALNADATFKTLFAATVPNAGVFNAIVAGSGALAGGTTASAVAVTFTEAIDPDSVDGADYNLDLNGDGVPEDATADQVDSTLSVSANTVVATFVTNNASLVPTAGTGKVQVVLGSTQDIANNLNATLLTATLS